MSDIAEECRHRLVVIVPCPAGTDDVTIEIGGKKVHEGPPDHGSEACGILEIGSKVIRGDDIIIKPSGVKVRISVKTGGRTEKDAFRIDPVLFERADDPKYRHRGHFGSNDIDPGRFGQYYCGEEIITPQRLMCAQTGFVRTDGMTTHICVYVTKKVSSLGFDPMAGMF